MKWFILFAGIMITSGAMAVTSLNKCPGIGWVVCGVVQVGVDVCCAPSSSQCDAYCGGGSVYYYCVQRAILRGIFWANLERQW